jgi:hypothetical protein
LHCARKEAGAVRLPGSGKWLSKASEGLAVGRIFFVFSLISGLLMLPPVMLLGCIAFPVPACSSFG